MAARLGVSPQTVLSLETRFAGRSETLARYLRVLGQHAVLALPARRLVPPRNAAEADLVYTPRDLARAVVDALRPQLSGTLLDPARGEGAFFDFSPSDNEHVGDFFKLGIADFLAQLFLTRIGFHADTP